MEYVLLAVVLLQSVFIMYMLNKSKPTVEVKQETEEEKFFKEERIRRENIDKSFQKLFDYNEDIATRGYKQ